MMGCVSSMARGTLYIAGQSVAGAAGLAEDKNKPAAASNELAAQDVRVSLSDAAKTMAAEKAEEAGTAEKDGTADGAEQASKTGEEQQGAGCQSFADQLLSRLTDPKLTAGQNVGQAEALVKSVVEAIGKVKNQLGAEVANEVMDRILTNTEGGVSAANIASGFSEALKSYVNQVGSAGDEAGGDEAGGQEAAVAEATEKVRDTLILFNREGYRQNEKTPGLAVSRQEEDPPGLTAALNAFFGKQGPVTDYFTSSFDWGVEYATGEDGAEFALHPLISQLNASSSQTVVSQFAASDNLRGSIKSYNPDNMRQTPAWWTAEQTKAFFDSNGKITPPLPESEFRDLSKMDMEALRKVLTVIPGKVSTRV